MFQGISIYEFNNAFKTEDDCRQYLFHYKWRNGYRCRVCGNTVPYKGRTRFNARCKQCYYDESVTANTVFHGMKIPLLKAFGMIFRIGTRLKGMSTTELAREFAINQKSSWLFKRKAQEAMQGAGSHPKHKQIQIAESLIIDGNGPKADSSAVVISNTRTTAGKRVIKAARKTKRKRTLAVDKSKNKRSSKCNAYSGTSFIAINLDNWVRGIHHHCSSRFQGGYRNEYLFRLNGRPLLEDIWHRAIVQFMSNKPYYYKAKESDLANRGV